MLFHAIGRHLSTRSWISNSNCGQRAAVLPHGGSLRQPGVDWGNLWYLWPQDVLHWPTQAVRRRLVPDPSTSLLHAGDNVKKKHCNIRCGFIFWNDSSSKINMDHEPLFDLQLVPPKVEEFVTVGHAAPQCTRKFFPEEGINVFAVFHHSHLTGMGCGNSFGVTPT